MPESLETPASRTALTIGDFNRDNNEEAAEVPLTIVAATMLVLPPREALPILESNVEDLSNVFNVGYYDDDTSVADEHNNISTYSVVGDDDDNPLVVLESSAGTISALLMMQVLPSIQNKKRLHSAATKK